MVGPPGKTGSGSRLPKDAIFINIGRGDVVSEGDLLKALDAGWLSAAILDVFVEEPLPKDSGLWRHPKVRVTPHAAAVGCAEDVAEAFLLNYKRFIDGQQVSHVVDWKLGY
ncbi:Glyoxylate/hydroxypyruvate reductase A [Chionoecetes opilio]|uniref:Glyoxylate/hydroxypyruvate reductase A n=1 Tax=Chionoecetes opilio TaxID=41210 RepID=A0A8J4YKR0_CHIOP|nr:Glyoxylate/hydroxypyruvate reductase A [Chionoecetes opilio]